MRHPARMIPTVPVGPRTRCRYWGPRRSREGTVSQHFGQGIHRAEWGPRRSRLVGPITASNEGQVCNDATVRTASSQGPDQECRTGPSPRASDCDRDHARALARALGPSPFGPPLAHGFRLVICAFPAIIISPDVIIFRFSNHNRRLEPSAAATGTRVCDPWSALMGARPGPSQPLCGRLRWLL